MGNPTVVVDGVRRRLDAPWARAALGVEIKGRAFHDDGHREADLLRDAGAVSAGITVLPLPARAVLRDLDAVLELVRHALVARWPAETPFAAGSAA